jgi:hypothetical protein
MPTSPPSKRAQLESRLGQRANRPRIGQSRNTVSLATAQQAAPRAVSAVWRPRVCSVETLGRKNPSRTAGVGARRPHLRVPTRPPGCGWREQLGCSGALLRSHAQTKLACRTRCSSCHLEKGLMRTVIIARRCCVVDGLVLIVALLSPQDVLSQQCNDPYTCSGHPECCLQWYFPIGAPCYCVACEPCCVKMALGQCNDFDPCTTDGCFWLVPGNCIVSVRPTPSSI